MSTFEVGEVVDKYKIVELVGVGGFGSVYKVQKIDSGETQALKLLKAGMWSEEELRERAQRELAGLRRLTSPFVVQVYDLHRLEPGRWFLTMEFVKGNNLDDLIDNRATTFKGEAAVPLFEKLAEAIAHAHEHQVIHRDIKPSNVIVEQDGRPRLVDFGIVAIMDLPRITEGAIGYRFHLAPEYFDGGPPTPSIDIYAFGITMYRVLTNGLPRQADGTFYRHDNPKQSKPIHPSDLCPEVPRWLGDVVMKALAKDPVARYQRMNELFVDLRQRVKGGAQEPESVRQVSLGRQLSGLDDKVPSGRIEDGKLVLRVQCGTDYASAPPASVLHDKSDTEFVVDIKSPQTWITGELARRLHLPIDAGATGFGRTPEGDVVYAQSCPIELRLLPSSAYGAVEVMFPVQLKAVNHREYGSQLRNNILGWNVLKDMLLVVDVPKHVFYLLPSDA